MRHDWILDVLTDLKAYAMANGMLTLARKTEEALDAARDEIGRAAMSDPPSSSVPEPRDRKKH